ncbi:GntR family transcriptional regulator [Ruania zhangjianzhongii]|uniref:GntR family transcriptional regulator n=1 Tax=Ruania zhangjianzhongii TaxID=2603206 RepID=UPI0011CC2809|nr:GntR family transcriptional regulator [Ruania zhangjianzhongii]
MRPRRRLPHDVAAELRQMITQDLLPGARLPGEKDLAASLDVSRNTLREALLQLWNEGLLVRRWGVGTFVRERTTPLAQNLTDFAPMREAIETAGKTAGLAAVSIEVVPCPAHVATPLELQPEDEVWRVERTFTADGEPLVTFIEWLPPVINGHAFDPTPLRDIDEHMLTLLHQNARTRVVRMEAELTAVGAPVAVAHHLNLAPGAHTLLTKQVSLTDAGDVVIYSELYYRTDGMALHIVRTPRF